MNFETQTYRGFQIITVYEDGTPLHRWAYYGTGKYAQFIEDVQADIDDYLDGEEDVARERREDDNLLTGETF